MAELRQQLASENLQQELHIEKLANESLERLQLQEQQCHLEAFQAFHRERGATQKGKSIEQRAAAENQKLKEQIYSLHQASGAATQAALSHCAELHLEVEQMEEAVMKHHLEQLEQMRREESQALENMT